MWSIYISKNEDRVKYIPAELNAGVILAPKARQKEPITSQHTRPLSVYLRASPYRDDRKQHKEKCFQ